MSKLLNFARRWVAFAGRSPNLHLTNYQFPDSRPFLSPECLPFHHNAAIYYSTITKVFQIFLELFAPNLRLVFLLFRVRRGSKSKHRQTLLKL